MSAVRSASPIGLAAAAAGATLAGTSSLLPVSRYRTAADALRSKPAVSLSTSPAMAPCGAVASIISCSRAPGKLTAVMTAASSGGTNVYSRRTNGDSDDLVGAHDQNRAAHPFRSSGRIKYVASASAGESFSMAIRWTVDVDARSCASCSVFPCWLSCATSVFASLARSSFGPSCSAALLALMAPPQSVMY